MARLAMLLILAIFLAGCTTSIKDKDAKVSVEEGAKVEEFVQSDTKLENESPQEVSVKEPQQQLQREEKFGIAPDSLQHLLGFWVGYFERDTELSFRGKPIYADEGFVWNRENKINISIDEIKDSLVVGHSVVAGNDRPFRGQFYKREDGSYYFFVVEPGDDKYDGEFEFSISKNSLSGKWTAYGSVEIRHRIYELEKKEFSYKPSIMLERNKRYIDWKNYTETKDTVEMEEDYFEEWVSREYSSATDLIYKINASTQRLTKETVENLKRGDLTIIRNTIYARHGYSFKSRPLRVFFDAQEWYIPVHTDIRSEFTEIEKQNIQLLLKYEENAAEYYDYFGRG